MSPSADDRREVAARLREAKRDCERRGYPWMTDDLILAIGYEHDYEADNGIFDRLADLIDSKCSMDAIDTGEQADYECCEHIMHCNCCGAEFGYVLYSEDGDVSMDDKPNFCPNCGARCVTSGGDS